MKIQSKKRLFSGIQPTGTLTVGHYIGAIRQWITLQESYHCFFSLVNLHAITTRQNPKDLYQQSFDMLALYLACGLDPKHHAIFLQSHVPAHSELAWIFACHATLGELSRMTQYKDKSLKHGKDVHPLGLLAYPVLMASDILLYDTTVVPVGEDQKQHLELARTIAKRFNTHYNNLFTLPTPVIPSLGARIMSLQDPNKKMSKSDPVIDSYIALLDDPDTIRRKVKRAVTDSGKSICQSVEKPGISNLLMLLSILTQQSIPNLESYYQGKNYGTLKSDLTEALIACCRPIQEAFYDLRKDASYLQTVLKDGAEKANNQASQKLAEVQQAIGFIMPAQAK